MNEVAFLLWTRDNPTQEQNLTFGDPLSVLESDFRPGQPIKIVAHGYTDDGKVPWIVTLRDEYLAAGKHILKFRERLYFAT